MSSNANRLQVEEVQAVRPNRKPIGHNSLPPQQEPVERREQVEEVQAIRPRIKPTGGPSSIPPQYITNPHTGIEYANYAGKFYKGRPFNGGIEISEANYKKGISEKVLTKGKGSRNLLHRKQNGTNNHTMKNITEMRQGAWQKNMPTKEEFANQKLAETKFNTFKETYSGIRDELSRILQDIMQRNAGSKYIDIYRKKLDLGEMILMYIHQYKMIGSMTGINPRRSIDSYAEMQKKIDPLIEEYESIKIEETPIKENVRERDRRCAEDPNCAAQMRRNKMDKEAVERNRKKEEEEAAEKNRIEKEAAERNRIEKEAAADNKEFETLRKHFIKSRDDFIEMINNSQKDEYKNYDTLDKKYKEVTDELIDIRIYKGDRHKEHEFIRAIPTLSKLQIDIIVNIYSYKNIASDAKKNSRNDTQWLSEIQAKIDDLINQYKTVYEEPISTRNGIPHGNKTEKERNEEAAAIANITENNLRKRHRSTRRRSTRRRSTRRRI